MSGQVDGERNIFFPCEDFQNFPGSGIGQVSIMRKTETGVSAVLLDKATEWLTRSSMAGRRCKPYFWVSASARCRRSSGCAGAYDILDASPTLRRRWFYMASFTGVDHRGFRHKQGEKPERFLSSPYYYLLSNKLDHLRRRFTPDSADEFPVLRS